MRFKRQKSNLLKLKTLPSKSLMGLGGLSSAICQWAIVIIIARGFGVEYSGIYAGMLAIATPVFVAGALALKDIYVSQEYVLNWNYYLSIRILGTAASVLVMTAISLLIGFPIFAVLGLCLLKFADNITDLYYGKLQRSERWSLIGSLQIFNAFTSICISVILLVLNGSFELIVYGSAAISVITTIITIYICKALDIQTFTNNLTCLKRINSKQIISSGTPVMFSQLLSATLLNMPVYVLTLLSETSYVGLYSVVSYLVIFGNLLGSIFANYKINSFRDVYYSNGNRELYRQGLKSLVVICVTSFPFVLLSVLVGDKLFLFLYGPEFYVPKLIIFIMALASVLASLGQISTGLLLVQGLYAQQVIFTFLSLIISIVLAALFATVFRDNLLLVASMIAFTSLFTKTLFFWLAALRFGKYKVK